jgi:hypothetical protein
MNRPLTTIQLDWIRIAYPEQESNINRLVWATERYPHYVELFDDCRRELDYFNWTESDDPELQFLGSLVEQTEQLIDDLEAKLTRLLRQHFQLPEFP